MAGVIIAIIMQRNELELQREELGLTRKQLTKTAEANKEQAEIQKLSAEIAGLTSLLNVTTDRLRKPRVEGAAGGWDIAYSPTQLLQFQNSYMDSIQTRVNQLTAISTSEKIQEQQNAIDEEVSSEA